MADLTRLSLTELASRIAAREVTPVDVTRAVLDEIHGKNDRLNAYITIYADEALKQAREAEEEIAAGQYRGMLHGIPMGLKDNLYFKDRKTTIGSKIHGDFVPDVDATVVARLREAGTVFPGKHNLHEYALGVTTENPHFGITRNPRHTGKTPGGSSGGAGAAIPSGMSIGALGSDTSGSIRIPAACCGIAGLKPTYGLVSKFGCFPEAWTLDHVGPMARSVTDLAAILDVISGHDARDPCSLNRAPTRITGTLTGSIKGRVIGLQEEFFFGQTDREVAAVVREAMKYLEREGAIIEPVEIPHLDLVDHAITIIDTSETTTVHHQTLQDRPQDYGDDVRLLIECGELPSAVDYLQAQQIRSLLQKSFAAIYDKVDVLIGPTLPIKTPDIGQTTTSINGVEADTADSLMRLVGPGNLLGLPSLSVPCGQVDGMPVGMEIMGPPLSESTVLDFGLAIEQARLYFPVP